MQDLDEHAIWYQWEHVEQMVQAKKGKSMKRVKKIQKGLKEDTVDDLLEDLEVQLPSFLEHVFVKRQQARFFKEKIEHLTEEEAVVQVDFAENTAASTREKFSQHTGAKTKLPCSLLQS